ncbi:hypothetical protein GALMADRAFT_134648 [Galerina marginata CBS 339.88]|uniref:Uncharacterized protein n=1 Tax=Galerina marginata (strain CBS 339.88) TaxID=685588 RepID=A0A067TVX4_GALM3|nr:hypothetical protein GALMADRAFT_134648 [Galerina marginata CBS 339.88]
MVNPGAFRGLRKEFMMNEKANYSEGVTGGYAADALALIFKRYFLRFPVELPHDQEPTAEFLASVDDSAPVPEYEEPDADTLSPEDYAAAIEKLDERRKTINFRKAQIKRWMAYQYMKDHDINDMDSGLDNPYRMILHKITGVPVQRPRQRSAVNTWRKTQREAIEHEVKLQTKKVGGVHRDKLAAFRDKIAKTMFCKLTKEEQTQWEEQAKEEQKERLVQWKRAQESPPSTEPAARQKCFEALPAFAQVFLDAICEATGCKATLLVGGPEPAHGGRLNVISVHSGTTSGDVKMTFGRLERGRYMKYFIPVFGSFLQACYSPEECRARALPAEDGYEPLQAAELEKEGFNLDSVSDTEPLPNEPLTNAPSIVPTTLAQPLATPATSTPPEAIPAPGSRAPSLAPSPPPSLAHSPPPSPYRSPLHGPAPALSPQPLPNGSVVASPISNRALQRAPSVVASLPPSPNASPRAGSPALDGLPLAPSPAPSPPPRNGVLHHPPAAVSSPRPPVAEPHAPPAPSPCLGAQQTQEGETSTQSGRKRKADSGPRINLQAKKRRSEPADKNDKAIPPRATRGSLARDRTTTSTPSIKHTRQQVSKKPSTVPQPSNSPPSAKTRKAAAEQPSSSNTPSVGASPASQAHESVIPPAEAPKWFCDALKMLQAEDLGDRWQEALRTWARFEQEHDYTEVAVLKPTHRPSLIKEWIARARSPTYRPTITSLAQYTKDYNAWWASLQPNWRLLPDGSVDFDAFDGKWEVLKRPGRNGLLSVLAALFYWGLAARKGKGRDNWLEAVKDFDFVVTCVCGL